MSKRKLKWWQATSTSSPFETSSSRSSETESSRSSKRSSKVVSQIKIMKNTRELEIIKKAINKWMKRHKNEVAFVGSFVAFEGENSEIVDDLIIAYGTKEMIKLSLKDLFKGLKEEKGDFINW